MTTTTRIRVRVVHEDGRWELYDADTGELLDEYGPNESPLFSLVPLEDSERDGLLVPLPPVDHDGGGGAVSWLALGGLLGALGLRRRRGGP